MILDVASHQVFGRIVKKRYCYANQWVIPEYDVQ